MSETILDQVSERFLKLVDFHLSGSCEFTEKYSKFVSAGDYIAITIDTMGAKIAHIDGGVTGTNKLADVLRRSGFDMVFVTNQYLGFDDDKTIHPENPDPRRHNSNNPKLTVLAPADEDTVQKLVLCYSLAIEDAATEVLIAGFERAREITSHLPPFQSVHLHNALKRAGLAISPVKDGPA